MLAVGGLAGVQQDVAMGQPDSIAACFILHSTLSIALQVVLQIPGLIALTTCSSYIFSRSLHCALREGGAAPVFSAVTIQLPTLGPSGLQLPP